VILKLRSIGFDLVLEAGVTTVVDVEHPNGER
jgi:hypothetical protein